MMESFNVDVVILILSAIVVATLFMVAPFFLPIIRVHFAKVDTRCTKHGGDVVAAILRSHGVRVIYTLVGGHISPILVSSEKMGLKIIDTRHEANAVFAADSYARITGQIGVVAVTAGPGLTNTVTAVKNAQLAESPVLLLGGAAATILKGRGALQDIDQMALFKSTCKFCSTVKRVCDIGPVLKEAIRTALSGVPGPVFVELPVDVLYPYQTVRKEMMGGQTPSSFMGRMTKRYLEYHIRKVFGNAWEPMDLQPLPVLTPIPRIPLVEKAALMVLNSKRPLILMGSQAMLMPKSVYTLQRAVLNIGIPTFLSGMSRGLLGRNAPIQVRHRRGQALKQADLVILAGSVCDFRLSYGRSLPKKGKIIAVNRSKDLARKNSDAFWKPNLVIEGDVCSFMIELATMVSGYQPEDGWLAQLKESDMKRDVEIMNLAEESDGEHLNPLKVLLSLERSMADNAIIVADGGDFVGSAAYILRPRGPFTWLDPGAFGTLGVGAGFAIGAKVACPEAQVWIIYGDGSCGYSIVEFDTFVRHNLSVIAVVGNDAGWSQIEREQKPMFGSSVACSLAFSNYHTVAKGLGAEGILITHRASQILDKFSTAQEMDKRGKSTLVNVFIEKTSFRDGSIAV